MKPFWKLKWSRQICNDQASHLSLSIGNDRTETPCLNFKQRPSSLFWGKSPWKMLGSAVISKWDLNNSKVNSFSGNNWNSIHKTSKATVWGIPHVDLSGVMNGKNFAARQTCRYKQRKWKFNSWTCSSNIEEHNWLVVTGTMEFYVFPLSWEFHHPNRRSHIFQRGRCTTNQPFIGIISRFVALWPLKDAGKGQVWSKMSGKAPVTNVRQHYSACWFQISEWLFHH